jgi:2-(1,2-epoxy-1,2-dihydrophenyl)acetyl-CoA isomerase
MQPETVKLARMGSLAVITVNRPQTRNALTPDMVSALGQAIESCRHRSVRAVLITGTAGAFCAGADVNDLQGHLEAGGGEALAQHLQALAEELHQRVILGIRRLEKPVVAAVNGVAAGAGFSLALACDLRLASSNARFLMAYANIGVSADGGSTYLLPRLVGMGRAMEIYTASQPMSADYARELGLVNQVIPDAIFERHSLEIAARLAQGPTTAYGQVKALFDRSGDSNLESQLDAEASAIGRIALTRDFQEGIRAFTQKRRPWFQGS